MIFNLGQLVDYRINVEYWFCHLLINSTRTGMGGHLLVLIVKGLSLLDQTLIEGLIQLHRPAFAQAGAGTRLVRAHGL